MAQHDRKDDDRERVVSLGHTSDMQSQSAGALVHLGDLKDASIQEGAPDVRGWEVKGADGESLGKVRDLLVDTGAMKVRYLEVELDRDVAKEAARTDRPAIERGTGRDDTGDKPFRHVLVPIGLARLDDDADEVRLRADARRIAGIPSYERGGITRDYERGLVGSYTGAPADVTDDLRNPDEFYMGERFDDRAFLGRRGVIPSTVGYGVARPGMVRGTGSMGTNPSAPGGVGPGLDPNPGGVGDPNG